VAAQEDFLVKGLARIHSALRRSLDTIVKTAAQPIADSDRAGFSDFCGRFTHLLRTHHEGEEDIVFPKFTSAAERANKPAFATHITTWRADHEQLLVKLGELEIACTQFGVGGAREPVATAAAALREILIPHLDAEEAALDGGVVGELLPPDEMVALGTAASNHGKRVGGPKALMLLVHALDADDQRLMFSDMPWFVRAVLVKRVWARGFRRCMKYAHNPSIAF
jgi:hypothetical protein